MTDIASIANLTPEESFKAGLPVVLQLEAWIAECERAAVDAHARRAHETAHRHIVEVRAYRRCLALVTAKDADRDLGQ